jgi:hypothetical protein
MIQRPSYNIRSGQSATDYAVLLESVAPLATSFGLIVRSNSIQLSRRAISVMRSLENTVISMDEVTQWPGTELIGGRRSSRYVYRLEPTSLDVLIQSASSLFDWVNPELPEDLHLIRSDGTPVLGTVAQDDDAWVELDDQEVAQFIESGAPWLGEATNRDDD